MFAQLKRYIKAKKHPYYTNQNRRYKHFKIGDFTYGKPKIYASKDMLEIGKFCSIADGVTIYAGAEHHHEWVSAYCFSEKFACKECSHSKGKVTIGNDVWIADGALILSGVTIGDGAVIGARAVVSKNVAPYEIVAGNPARHIRFRFSNEQIENLLTIQWWEWDIEKIKTNFDLILSPNIDSFIQTHLRELKK